MEYSKIFEALNKIFYLIGKQGCSCRGTQETQTHSKKPFKTCCVTPDNVFT